MNEEVDIPRVQTFLIDTVSSIGVRIFTLHGLYRGHIGIPYYAMYKTKEEVNLSEIKHKTTYVPFVEAVRIRLGDIQRTPDNAEDYDALVETLVLSDNAKQFFLATQIVEFGSQFCYFGKAFRHFIWFPFYYFTSASINHYFKMFTRYKETYFFYTRARRALRVYFSLCYCSC
jgi:hypothetical protein